VQRPRKSAEFAAAPGSPPAAHAERAEDFQRAAAADADARYAEYLRVLDDVPVLFDVVSEPPRVVVRDFRLGQRPNVRKCAREDAYAVRERQAAELAGYFAEYELRGDAPEHGAPRAAQTAAKKKTKRPKGGKRGKRRKH